MEPQRGSASAQHQLQGAALQNSSVWTGKGNESFPRRALALDRFRTSCQLAREAPPSALRGSNFPFPWEIVFLPCENLFIYPPRDAVMDCPAAVFLDSFQSVKSCG